MNTNKTHKIPPRTCGLASQNEYHTRRNFGFSPAPRDGHRADSPTDTLTSRGSTRAKFRLRPLAKRHKKPDSRRGKKLARGQSLRIIERASRRAVTRYDLISCVNCSLVNCQSHSSRELVVAAVCRYGRATLFLSPSLSIGRTPCAPATVVVVGHRTPPQRSPIVIAGVQ